MITVLDPDLWVNFMREPNLRHIHSPSDLNFNMDYSGESVWIKAMYNVPAPFSVTQQWNYNCLLLEKNSRFLFGNEIWILIILEYTEVQWILFCPYLQIHTNTCFFHFQSWECQRFNLILSLKERFLEWVEHPLQTILLSASVHIVNSQKGRF